MSERTDVEDHAMAKRILVATDGSDTAERAVDTASRLAKALGKELCIVHVLMHGRPSEEWLRMAEVEHLAERVMPEPAGGGTGGRITIGDVIARGREDAAASRMLVLLGDEIVARAKARAEDAGVPVVTTRVSSGDYADEILDLAEAEDAEMIVMGRRGLGRVRGARIPDAAARRVEARRVES